MKIETSGDEIDAVLYMFLQVNLQNYGFLLHVQTERKADFGGGAIAYEVNGKI